MTRSILEGIFSWRHISKSRQPNNLKFCMFTSFIHTITSTKFQINQLTLTLFSGSGPKSPPVAGKISKCRKYLCYYQKLFGQLVEPDLLLFPLLSKALICFRKLTIRASISVFRGQSPCSAWHNRLGVFLLTPKIRLQPWRIWETTFLNSKDPYTKIFIILMYLWETVFWKSKDPNTKILINKTFQINLCS